jgi:SAM-dependent methyltransferase
MQTEQIRKDYDELIAPHYDHDPQSVLGDSLDRAVVQIVKRLPAPSNGELLRLLDVGMGTGRFLEKLRGALPRAIQPFGLDLSEKMIECARARHPDLTAVVGDAESLRDQFSGESFDLISTHFITGYVPVSVLAPQIWDRLAEGGYWSIVGGTKDGFPALQKKANNRLLRWLFGVGALEVDDVIVNPKDHQDLANGLEANGFVIQETETFRPPLSFANLDEFLEFAYYGGWLTPFVEKLGLHKARGLFRRALNTFVFPARDNHSIEIALARKGPRRPRK